MAAPFPQTGPFKVRYAPRSSPLPEAKVKGSNFAASRSARERVLRVAARPGLTENALGFGFHCPTAGVRDRQPLERGSFLFSALSPPFALSAASHSLTGGRNATLSTLRTCVRGAKGRRQDPFGAGRQEDNENRWKQTTNCQHTPTHTCTHQRRNGASQSRDKGERVSVCFSFSEAFLRLKFLQNNIRKHCGAVNRTGIIYE